MNVKYIIYIKFINLFTNIFAVYPFVVCEVNITLNNVLINIYYSI